MSYRLIRNGDSRDLSFLPDATVSLVVTSPPYNVGIRYSDHDDCLPLAEYLKMLSDVFRESYRVLEPGGHVAVNVAGLDRTPYLPLDAYVTRLLVDLGFEQPWAAAWDKGASVGSSTAWGSWCRPSNPTLRDVHEAIVIAVKPGGAKSVIMQPPQHMTIGVFSHQHWKLAGPGETDLSAEEFVAATKSMWRNLRRWADVAARLVRLYTWIGGHVVLVARPSAAVAEVDTLLTGMGRRVTHLAPESVATADQVLPADVVLAWSDDASSWSPSLVPPGGFQRLLTSGGRLCVSNPAYAVQADWALELIQAGFGMRGIVLWDREPGQERSIWPIATVSAKKVGHPAPYPIELPRRAIRLLTRVGDVVLDPFSGSGTSCQAAESLGRQWVGVDKDPAYCRLGRHNLGLDCPAEPSV